jgi:hypothetical protein
MSRAYMNNTSESVTYKIWTIDPTLVTQSNLKTLTSRGVKATIIPADPRVLDYRGYQYRYSSQDGRVEFETTCDEQELMLKLLYGKDLLLLTVDVVAPYSVMHSDV